MIKLIDKLLVIILTLIGVIALVCFLKWQTPVDSFLYTDWEEIRVTGLVGVLAGLGLYYTYKV